MSDTRSYASGQGAEWLLWAGSRGHRKEEDDKGIKEKLKEAQISVTF